VKIQQKCFAELLVDRIYKMLYLMGDGWLTKALDKIFGTEDIETAIGNRIAMIRRNVEGLNLNLSKALEYELK